MRFELFQLVVTIADRRKNVAAHFSRMGEGERFLKVRDRFGKLSLLVELVSALEVNIFIGTEVAANKQRQGDDEQRGDGIAYHGVIPLAVNHFVDRL